MKDRVARILGSDVVRTQRAAGGCIADASLLHLADGRLAFAKQVNRGVAPFRAEALCLEALHEAGGVRVPEVWHADEHLLILEGIESGPPGRNYMEAFGRQLAQTHRATSDLRGFAVDHVIGATPQQNTPQMSVDDMSWPEFWWRYRMEPMMRHVENQGCMTASLRAKLYRLEAVLPGLLRDTGETSSLLHGDLWAGNAMADAAGNPVMFDPASYYGHRETDLAMTRMFGGFDARFYDAYDEAWPLTDGWRERLDLYMIYHVLNHIPGYGMSYAMQAERICDAVL